MSKFFVGVVAIQHRNPQKDRNMETLKLLCKPSYSIMFGYLSHFKYQYNHSIFIIVDCISHVPLTNGISFRYQLYMGYIAVQCICFLHKQPLVRSGGADETS